MGSSLHFWFLSCPFTLNSFLSLVCAVTNLRTQPAHTCTHRVPSGSGVVGHKAKTEHETQIVMETNFATQAGALTKTQSETKTETKTKTENKHSSGESISSYNASGDVSSYVPAPRYLIRCQWNICSTKAYFGRHDASEYLRHKSLLGCSKVSDYLWRKGLSVGGLPFLDGRAIASVAPANSCENANTLWCATFASNWYFVIDVQRIWFWSLFVAQSPNAVFADTDGRWSPRPTPRH